MFSVETFEVGQGGEIPAQGRRPQPVPLVFKKRRREQVEKGNLDRIYNAAALACQFLDEVRLEAPGRDKVGQLGRAAESPSAKNKLVRSKTVSPSVSSRSWHALLSPALAQRAGVRAQSPDLAQALLGAKPLAGLAAFLSRADSPRFFEPIFPELVEPLCRRPLIF